RRGAESATPHVGSVGAAAGRVDDRGDELAGQAAAVGTEALEWHDPGAGGHAGDPDTVVGACGDCAAHVRAVPVVVEWVGVGGLRREGVAGRNESGEVPTGDVVDVPIAVVVDHIAGDLARVGMDAAD